MPLSLLFGSQIDWQLSLCPYIIVFRWINSRHSVEGKPSICSFMSICFPVWPDSHPEHITKSRGFRNWKVEIGSFFLWSQAVACLVPCLEDKSVLEQTVDLCWGVKWIDSCWFFVAPFKDLLGEFHTPLAVWQKGEKSLESTSSSQICLLPQYLSLYLSLTPVSFCLLWSFWWYPHLTKAHWRQELVYSGKGCRLWSQIY